MDNDKDLTANRTAETANDASEPDDRTAAADRMTETAGGTSEAAVDEIISYYEENDDRPVLDETKPAEDVPRQVNKLRESAVSAASAVASTASAAVNAVIPEDEKGRGKYLWLIIAAALVVIIGFFVGFAAISADEDRIESKKEELQKTDTAYLAANSENVTLNASIAALEESSENIEKTFDSVLEYQKQYDALSEEYDGYKSSYDKLTAEYDELKSDYDETSAKLEKLKTETVTLTPGAYTVGEHIAAGNYTVTGDGSMLAADSGGSLKINVMLTDDDYECALSAGDVIKLETSAEFAPAE